MIIIPHRCGLLALLALFPSWASAGVVYLNTNLAAYHWDRDSAHKNNYNERNAGLGIEQIDGKVRKAVGYYQNSLYKYSFYVAAGYTPLGYQTPLGTIQAGLTIGMVTGYPQMLIVPVVAGLVSFTGKRMGANLIFVPSASNGGSKADGFAGLQLRYKLK